MSKENPSVKDRLRSYFEENVGKVLTKDELSALVRPATEWARRVRELRDEEGMQIHTHHDDLDLKPGEYRLVSTNRLPAIARDISAQKRMRILERNGYTCQFCGASQGETDPVNPGRKIRLHIDHIVPVSQGGSNEDDNLRVICSACNQGRGAIQAPSESAKNLLMRIRKQPNNIQREVYEQLRKKFGETNQKSW